MSESHLVTGLFKDRESAERAYKAVTERGYSKGDVTVAMSDDTRERQFTNPGMIEEGDEIVEYREKPNAGDDDETELGTMAAEGAGIGAGIGGTIGAIVVGLAAIGGAIALPGVGMFVAGPIAAALVGAGAGAATGGLVGALVGWGIPEERVKDYEAGINEGGILMSVKANTHEDADHFVDMWKQHSGEHVYR